LAVTTALTGCDTATGPEDAGAFDAEAAMADYDALAAALGADELDPFRALPAHGPFGSFAAGAAALQEAAAEGAADGGRRWAARVARRLATLAAPPAAGAVAAPIISGSHRGRTFVYDPGLGEYRPDPDRPGAPADGVRFVLYALDAGGTPLVEDEVGYADLIDEGDGSAEDVALRLVVVHGEQTVLDYRTTVDASPGRGALTARGFLSGDGVRLDFDVTLEGREGNGVDEVALDFELAVAARDFRVTGRLRGAEGGGAGTGEVELDIRHGPDRLSLTATGQDGVLDGAVSLDGAPFAVFQGPEEDLEITAPDGRPLTGLEALALQRAVDVVEDVFDFVEDLLDPVDDLVLLGIVL
jgi:hypothetical protein